MKNIDDGKTTSQMPPAISDMGTSSEFMMYIEDRGGKGYHALKQATDQLLVHANQSRVLGGVAIDDIKYP